MSILTTIKNNIFKYKKILYTLIILVVWSVCVEIITYVDIKLHPDNYVSKVIRKYEHEYPMLVNRECLSHYYFEGNHHIFLLFSNDSCDISIYCEVFLNGLGECWTMKTKNEGD